MIKLALLFMILSFGHAQADTGNFSDTPLCVTVKNTAGVETMAHVATAYFTDKTGKLRRYNQTFKLADGASQEVCSTGPFLPGNTLRVEVKTSIPLWTCRIPMTPQGALVTISRRVGSTDVNDLVMDCPEAR